MRTTYHRLAIAAVGLFGAQFAIAQSSVPSEIRLSAIVGARIEVGNGKVIEKGTLVLRNGIIEAIGTDVVAPAGAEIVDGTGLTVFPGFIDAYTRNGLKTLPAPVDGDVPSPTKDYASASMRAANRKGIHPELEARSWLDLPDGTTKPYHSAGFTTIAVTPSGGYLNGIGTLVNLSGRPPRDAVVVPRTTLAITMDGGGDWNRYPGSLLGVVAHVRQTFLDSQWLSAQTTASAQGGERAPSDPALEALQPVLAGTLGASIEANGTSQIDRALNLTSEFGLRTTLVGVSQAYRRLDAIKQSGVSLVLGLNFGIDPRESTTKEPSVRTEERKRLFREAVANLDAVRTAGIAFSLTTHGCKDPSEFMKNLCEAVKLGFPREAALAALTIAPAKQFGLESRLGSIEVGKLADVVVMKGDFLAEDAKVQIVFVDGYKFEFKGESK